MTISLIDCKKYYQEKPHQILAVEYLGKLLLKTPARNKLGLIDAQDWIKLSDEKLAWLQRQIGTSTLDKFTEIWRNHIHRINYFSQRDNKILPYTSCNSSSHAMFVDYILRKLGKGGLSTDDEYVSRVYSGKYGSYGKNNSMSWDIQMRVVRSFGIKARYNNQGKKALLAQLSKGYICPTNFRHKGSMYKSYGGHVVVIAGYDKYKGFLIYDPYGNCMPDYKDTENGIYWMSEKEFNYRWQGLFTEYVGHDFG